MSYWLPKRILTIHFFFFKIHIRLLAKEIYINLKTKRPVEVFLFQEKDGDYCAVCLDLNLIEWGKHKEKLQKSIFEAAHSYLQGVIDNNLPNELLNKPALQKYWKFLRVGLAEMVTKSSRVEHNSSIHQVNPNFFGFESTPYGNEYIRLVAK
ncbi:MAG: hypothetical protein ABIJ03_02780 [Patescibacteria group bacterium]|nr:hypothetical protein [Patescibacteria group bacterium]